MDTFDKNSGLVKLWVALLIKPKSKYTREQVPPLDNLREIVYGVLDGVI